MSEKVGFIGLGNIGKPIAINVCKAGHDLMVYDLRPERLPNIIDKDLRLALAMGRELGLSLPAGALAQQSLDKIV